VTTQKPRALPPSLAAELLKDHQPLQSLLEPERCPDCQRLMAPEVNASGRIVYRCPTCPTPP